MMNLPNCPTCEQILAGASRDTAAKEDWKRFWPYILIALVVLAALYLYKRKKKG